MHMCMSDDGCLIDVIGDRPFRPWVRYTYHYYQHCLLSHGSSYKWYNTKNQQLPRLLDDPQLCGRAPQWRHRRRHTEPAGSVRFWNFQAGTRFIMVHSTYITRVVELSLKTCFIDVNHSSGSTWIFAQQARRNICCLMSSNHHLPPPRLQVMQRRGHTVCRVDWLSIIKLLK